MDIFMKANPEVKVTVIVNPTEQYNNALELSFAANEGPDIFFIEGGQPQARTVCDNKWVEPLDSYIDDAFVARFPEGAFSQTSQTRVNGEVIGIPVRDPRFDKVRPLYYNKTILEQYGYSEPPKTHSKFVEAHQYHKRRQRPGVRLCHDGKSTGGVRAKCIGARFRA